jgi:hypothetical protein
MVARRISIGPSRWHNDGRHFEQHIRPRLGGAPMTSIAAYLNALYADIRENGRIRGEGPLAPSTVLRAHVILQEAFADAVRRGYLDHDPADAADTQSTYQHLLPGMGEAAARRFRGARPRARRGGGSVVTPDARYSVVARESENPAEAGFPGADDEIRTRDLHLGKVAL